MYSRKSVISKLKSVFDSDSSVKLAYLFGSYAKGKAGKLSDIDIAVLLDSKMTKAKIFKKQTELIDKISRFVDDFDLVILNEKADLLLKFNIIKEGVLLKNSPVRPKFEFEIIHEYLDMGYHEQLRSDALINRVAKRGFV